jgi:Flp pilus assembly protein TadD
MAGKRTSRVKSWLTALTVCIMAFVATYFFVTAPFRGARSTDSSKIEEAAFSLSVQTAAAETLPPNSLEQPASERVASTRIASGQFGPSNDTAFPEPSSVSAPVETVSLLPQATSSAARTAPAEPSSSPTGESEYSILDGTEPCTVTEPTFSDADAQPPERRRAIEEAREALRNDDAVGALDAVREFLADDSLGAAEHFVAGSALLKIGATAEARDHLEQAAWLAPDQAGVWIKLAGAHLDADAHGLAYRAARRALKLAPQDHRAHHAFGRALMALNRSDEALPVFEQAVGLCPDNADAWNAIGLVWLYRGENEKARAALEKAVFCTGCPSYAHNNLGIVYEQLGLYEWADREYARCLELDPEHLTAKRSRSRVAPFLAVRPWTGQSRTR